MSSRPSSLKSKLKEILKLKNTRSLTYAAIIAALYVALTWLANMLGLASGAIQIRLSEVLTVLPFFTPAAIPGLFIGCFLANIITGCAIWDIIFGSIATLIGAVGTYHMKNHKNLALLPPIIANTLIIPFVLVYTYGLEGTVPYFMLTVFIGEAISCGILGRILLGTLEKHKESIFK